MPFVGIPALIIKNWETIKAFFVGLWVQVSELFKAAIAGIKNFFVAAWIKIQEFFAFIWDGMISIVVNAANWFSNVWASVTGAFAAAWIWVGDLFSSVWESIKGVIMGFAAWLQPVIDFIIAPFKAIGAVIGGIIDTVGGWFDSTVDKGNAKLAEMTENTMKAATASPAEPSVSASAVVEPLPPSAMSASANPIAPPTMTTTSAVPIPSTGAGGGGNALLGEHLAAASRKGIAGNINAAASNAFMGASSGPAIDIADYSAEAQGDFSEALRPMQTQILQTPWSAPETKKTKDAPRTITIQNLTLQADGILDVINFVRQLELAVLEPMEAAL